MGNLGSSGLGTGLDITINSHHKETGPYRNCSSRGTFIYPGHRFRYSRHFTGEWMDWKVKERSGVRVIKSVWFGKGLCAGGTLGAAGSVS